MRAGLAAALVVVALALALAGCASRLELGERRYQEGDRLAALETWRSIRPDAFGYDEAQARIRQVEAEFDQLVVRYKKRGRYYEERERLAESVLNYRLALALRPEDRETLERVQELVRVLDERRRANQESFHEAFDAGNLSGARASLDVLVTLDPFSPQIALDERRLEAAMRERVERLLARGRRGFGSGNHRSAERAFQGVLELDPDNESARGYLSYIAKIREEEANGARAAAGSGARDPREVDATDAEIRSEGFFQNALASEREGDLYEAIRFDLRALRSNPSHPRAFDHLSGLRRRLAPEIPRLIEAGRRHYQQEELQAALDQWRRALLIDPENEEAQEYAVRAERLLENLDRLRDDPAPGTSGS